MSVMTLKEARMYAKQRRDLTHQLKVVLIERLSLDIEVSELPDDCLMFGLGLGLDSVDALEIAVAVEAEMDVQVTDENIQEMRSINAIVDHVIKYREATNNANSI